MINLRSSLDAYLENSKIKEITFISIAGQGALVGAEVLAGAAINLGKHVYVGVNLWGQRRMAAVKNTVRIADNGSIPSCSDHIPTEMIVFDEKLYDTSDENIRSSFKLFEKGHLLICTDKDPDQISFPFDFKGSIATCNCSKICLDILGIDPPPSGVTTLGMYAAATGISMEAIESAVKNKFKGKSADLNIETVRKAFKETKVWEHAEFKGRISRNEYAVTVLDDFKLNGASGNTNKEFYWREKLPVCNRNMCICVDCVVAYHCPEEAISFNGQYSVDYDYCKGCGICASECVNNAIKMVEEKQAVRGIMGNGKFESIDG